MLTSLVGLRSMPATPIMQITITATDQVNAILVAIAVAFDVFAVLTLIASWLLSGFGYWIAGDTSTSD